MTSLKLGGYDPLDAQLDEATIARPRELGPSPSRVPLARWSASSVPVASLLLVGIVLGPHGISLISSGVISLLDPAIPVALAALGALVGLSLEVGGRGDRRPLAAAVLESAVTALLVTVAMALAAPLVWAQTVAPLWMLAAALGICGASSLAVPGATAEGPGTVRARIVELDVLFPIVAGGIFLGILHAGVTTAALAVVGQTIIITVLLASAAWLLLARAASDTEQRVFAFAAMLLIGGVADYLSLSALLSGLAAGIFWRLARGLARESLFRDLLYTQHSLLVLVLVVAGARTDFSLPSLAVAVAYLLVRMGGKLLGGALAGRLARADHLRHLGLYLLSPGVFGVALALNIVRSVGADADVLLSIVVLGTIGSEVASELGQPPEPPASGRDPVVSP
jgi:hypothetical protein